MVHFFLHLFSYVFFSLHFTVLLPCCIRLFRSLGSLHVPSFIQYSKSVCSVRSFNCPLIFKHQTWYVCIACEMYKIAFSLFLIRTWVCVCVCIRPYSHFLSEHRFNNALCNTQNIHTYMLKWITSIPIKNAHIFTRPFQGCISRGDFYFQSLLDFHIIFFVLFYYFFFFHTAKLFHIESHDIFGATKQCIKMQTLNSGMNKNCMKMHKSNRRTHTRLTVKWK